MSLLGSLPTVQDFSRAAGVLSTTLLLLLVTGWALLRHLPKSNKLFQSGIFLRTRTDRAIGYESAEKRTDLVGTEGVAATDLRPSGVGIFHDERVDIVSESEWIEEGTPIRVVSAEGYRQIVRPVSSGSVQESSDQESSNEEQSDEEQSDEEQSDGGPS